MRWIPLVVMLLPVLAQAAPCEKPDAQDARATATDDAVTACFGDAPARTCWRFDVAARTWAPAPSDAIVDSAPAPPAADHVELVASVRVCAPAGSDCHVFTVPGTGARTQTQLIHNTDRSLVAIFGRPGPIELFDGKTAARLASIKGPHSPMLDGFEAAQFVGDSVVGFTQDSPVSDVARLYDGRTGRLLANIGGRDAINSPAAQLAGTRWLFSGFYGDAIYLYDVATGRLVRTIKLVAGHQNPGSGPAVMHVSADAKQVTAMRGDAKSGVVVYDVAADKQTRYAVPTCK